MSTSVVRARWSSSKVTASDHRQTNGSSKAEVPPDLPLPPSTVHRLLACHGLMDGAKTAGDDRGRRRFAFEQAGELWMSDVTHGPSVLVGEQCH